MNSVKKHRGFTLIEVMIAMVVVSFAVMALVTKMMGAVDNTAYLRDKTIAQWVALNQVELERIKNRRSNTLRTESNEGREEMAGQEWYWTVKPLEIALEGAVKLEVSVAPAADADPIVTLISIQDQFHRD